jgi:hypothetical protein
MITLVDSDGIIQDPEPFKKRIELTPIQKGQIREYLGGLEQGLILGVPLQQDDIADPMRNFLQFATYAENLLDTPFIPSEETSQQIYDYWDQELYFSFSNNRDLYTLEKMTRLGLRKTLEEKGDPLFKDGWLDSIKSEEERRFVDISNHDTSGLPRSRQMPTRAAYLIKYLNRYKGLGLDVDSSKTQVLQGFWNKYPNSNGRWLSCSALRLGLDLPPCSVQSIDKTINRIGELSSFTHYLSALHHLHRLFGNDVSPNGLYDP